MLDCTEDSCKIWRQTDLYVLKWHKEFGKFLPEHVQKSKNRVLSWVLLCKVENVWAWNLHGSYMSWEWRMMENLKRNWLVNSKLIWVIWWILHRALQNFKNLNFNELLLTEVYNVWAKKKYRGVMFDCAEDWCKIWRQTDLYFLIWHEEFWKFSSEHVRKSKNWVLSWVLLSKVENLWAWNLHGSYMSWEWRMMKNLKRKWLVNSKLTWVIW